MMSRRGVILISGAILNMATFCTKISNDFFSEFSPATTAETENTVISRDIIIFLI